MKDDYLEAYNFITENYQGVKGNLAQIYNFRYTIANKAGLGRVNGVRLHKFTKYKTECEVVKPDPERFS